MKALITGGAGFLGLHLTHYFTKKSAEVILLDSAPFPKGEYPKNVRMIEGDIRDAKLIDRLTKNIDVLIHAAAALPLRPAEEIMDVNVNGTQNLLKYSLKNKVKRFIYISSTAVYGVPKKHPVYESDPMVGVGPYGHSKIDAEKQCQIYRRKGLFVTLIHFMISPKNKLGPGDREGKKDSLSGQRVTNFSKSYVLTLSKEDTMRQAVDLVLEKKIGSVIIVDAQKHPVGIITTRDFFNLVLRPSFGSQIYLFTKNLSRSSADIVQGFYGSLQTFFKNQNDIAKAKLMVKEEKQGGVFKVFLSMLSQKGQEAVIKKEGKNLHLILQEVKEKMRNISAKQHSMKR